MTPKVSLVVDLAAARGRGVLILPFAAAEPEAMLGRQVGLLLQRQLQALPDLEVGHGHLLAVTPEGRQHVPLVRPLSVEQALTCGAGWGAHAVISGAISLQPSLCWTVTVHDVASGALALEQRMTGDPDDLLEVACSVAHAVAVALGYDRAALERVAWDEWQTHRLDALLAHLQALDARLQPAALEGQPSTREWLLRACVLDPTFAAPAQALAAEMAAASDPAPIAALLVAIARPWGQEGAATLARLAALLDARAHARAAGALVDAVLTWLPTTVPALEIAARHALRAGRFAQARALLDLLLDARPDHLAARELLADALAAEGRFAGAAQQWELLVEQRAPNPRVLMRLGAYLAVIGEHRRAHALLRQAAAYDCVTVDALYQLGEVSYRTGAYAEAIAALRRALERDPAAVRAHALLARCYRRVGNDDLAYVHDARTVALAPDVWPSALALGFKALQDARADAALVSFAQAVNVRPDLAEAWQGLGMALLASGMVDDAREVLQRAHTLNPTDATSLCALALAHARAGDGDGAVRALRCAEQLAPRNAMVAQCRLVLRQDTSLL
jgi:Flp pilus assembly protein TadD